MTVIRCQMKPLRFPWSKWVEPHAGVVFHETLLVKSFTKTSKVRRIWRSSVLPPFPGWFYCQYPNVADQPIPDHRDRRMTLEFDDSKDHGQSVPSAGDPPPTLSPISNKQVLEDSFFIEFNASSRGTPVPSKASRFSQSCWESSCRTAFGFSEGPSPTAIKEVPISPRRHRDIPAKYLERGSPESCVTLQPDHKALYMEKVRALFFDVHHERRKHRVGRDELHGAFPPSKSGFKPPCSLIQVGLLR